MPFRGFARIIFGSFLSGRGLGFPMRRVVPFGSAGSSLSDLQQARLKRESNKRDSKRNNEG